MSSCPQCKAELPDKGAGVCPACRNRITATDSFYTSPTVVATSAEAQRIAELWRPSLKGTETIISTLKGGEASATQYPSVVVKARALKMPDREHPAHVEPDYELLKVLGEGGIGVVYAARQTSVDRIIALKMLKPDAAGDARIRSSFMTEATVTADLDHPNIVPVHELGSDEHGELYYSMKQVVGTPWRKVMAQRTLPENVEVLLRVSDAVAFAHSRGIVHRDLKPDNVMLGDYGEVLVMDWGLASAGASEGGSKAFPLSAETAIGGTPAYMAPEMARGEVERIGPASDIYLLGAILYEIVAGFPPHHGDDAVTCIVAAAMNRIRPTDKTGELVEIAVRAMATEPGERYAGVKEFQGAIRAYLSHAESVNLSAGAARTLQQARATGRYEDYARAMYTYEHALELWPENLAAQDGAREARLAYAEAALGKGDLDLASSSLTAAQLGETPLGRRIAAARNERDSRARRIKILAYIAVILGLSVLSTYTLGYFRIRAEQSKYVAEMSRAVLSETIAAREKEKLLAARAAEAQERHAVEAEVRHAARLNYLNGIAVAELALAAGDAVRAQRALSESAAELRGWEWGWLAARVAIGGAAPQSWPGFEGAARIALDRSGRTLLVAQGKSLALWDVESRRELRRFERGATTGTASIVFTPAGDAVLFPDGGAVRMVEVATGVERARFEGGAPGAASLSADGRRLAVLADERTAVIRDARTGQVLSRLAGWSTPVKWEPVCMSPLGRRVLTGVSRERLVRLWDAETGVALRTYSRFPAPVTALFVAPDGDIVFAGCGDGAGRLFEIESGREIATFTGVYESLGFSPDGRRLLTAQTDGTVRLWETETGREVLSMPGALAAFSGDGRRMALLDRAGVLRILETVDWTRESAESRLP
jgi:hypothetical protein